LYPPCVISGYRRDVIVICALLGSYVTYNSGFLSTFRDKLSKKNAFWSAVYLCLYLTAFPFVHRLMAFSRHICSFVVSSLVNFPSFLTLSTSFSHFTSGHPRRLLPPGYQVIIHYGNMLSCTRTTCPYNFKSKGKAVPLQAWSGPEGSRKLRFPHFMTTAQDGGKVVSLTHRPPLPLGNTLGTHFC